METTKLKFSDVNYLNNYLKLHGFPKDYQINHKEYTLKFEAEASEIEIAVKVFKAKVVE